MTPKPVSESFRKQERLVSRKTIAELIGNGSELRSPLFRMKWQLTALNSPSPAQIAFSVPKRTFRLAVERNRIKRMMREVYRKNKGKFYPLLMDGNLQCALLLIFTGKNVPDFTEVRTGIELILQQLVSALKKNP